jgi:hypothetical protein
MKDSSFSARDESGFWVFGNKEQIKKKKRKVNVENYML